MATSKSGGSTQNGRDSIGRRLGVKLYDGQKVLPNYDLVQAFSYDKDQIV